uniref:Death domain-containing protein n=1 Tax=Amphimedon queenslandica TaxID=400682 RepID=A0A1X7T016_AMPQE
MDDPRSVLSIGDLNFVVSKLERNDFPEDRWNELGLKLHISQPKLNTVKANNPLDVKGCLRRCLVLWLQQSYDVDKYGLPTMQLLATVVEEMGLGAVAIKIGKIEGPEGPLLQISDLEYVFVTLNEVSFPPTQWIPLGLALGLDHQTLEAIKANDYRNIHQYLRECLSWWLQRFDDVDAKEKPKMTTLCDALERIGQKAVADYIRLKALDQKLASPIQAVDDEASSPGFGSHFLKEGIYKEIQERSYEINESNIMLKEELDAAKKKIAELEEKLDTAEKELYYTAEKANIILREGLDAAKKEIAELEEKLNTAEK